MRRRALLLALLVLPATARPQPLRALAPGEVLRGRFVQERRLKGFDRPLVSSGDFVLAPGLGLIWRTEKPFAIVTVITAHGLTQDVGGSRTTTLAAAKLPFLARLYDLLGGALSGDWRALESGFQVARHGDPQHWDVVLTPRGDAKPEGLPFRSVALRGGEFLDEATIAKHDDDTDRIVFSDQRIGGNLAPADAARLRDAGP